MAKIFLDTNVLVDYLERKNISISHLRGHKVAISPLSTHILFSISKNLVPQSLIAEALEQFSIVSFNQSVHDNSLIGPTSDFEDNVQLHSASNYNAAFFLTSDKQLCSMKFFGTMKIIKPEEVEIG